MSLYPYFTPTPPQAAQLGLQGTTILAASGDDGVAGFGARLFGPVFCSYLAMFPASSPYVTAVGGTMVGRRAYVYICKYVCIH
ncbi:hypothetical protein B484DRAFT_453590 [Ochromonadaceae sp. CCMP2298]|nr:hypothetical protein B484DRAFT_453590 [Ochromonadaceae sp. CCMP2298]